MNVLCFNPGSGTLTYRLVQDDQNGDSPGGMIDGIKGETAAADAAAEVVSKLADQPIDAIGFRIVHGGPEHFRPARIDESLIGELESIQDLAPVHLPTNIAVIRAVTAKLDRPSIAVFDTGFHQTIPQQAYRYPLPKKIGKKYRRYGFHGLAHQWVSDSVRCDPSRIGHIGATDQMISIHFGGGASACAVQRGKSIATTMGMTPLEGLMMSTRCGSIDPAIVLSLLRDGYSVDETDHLLNFESGLLGVSEISDDIREIIPAANQGDSDAQLALDLYAYRVKETFGAYFALLGGCDVLAISGALVKENPFFRKHVLGDLGCFGLQLDVQRNDTDEELTQPTRLSSDASNVTVAFIPADEERQIAADVRAFLSAESESGAAK